MKKQRNSKQRQEVLQSVLSNKNHPTADQLYLSLREDNPRISRGTVYRNLSLLSDNGEIQQIKTPRADRFDWQQDKHYHLICTVCNIMTDANITYDSSLDNTLAEETDYNIVRHSLIFEGVCPSCQKDISDKV